MPSAPTPTDARSRLPVQSLLAAGLYGALLGVLWVSEVLEFVDPALATPAALYIASGPLAFLVAQRTAWARRQRDPSLTLYRMRFAVSCVLLCYAMNPVSRSVLLILMPLVMLFGMFALTPQESHQLQRLTIAATATLMAVLGHVWPEVYDPRIDLVNIVVLVGVLPTLNAVAQRMWRLRQNLAAQGRELAQALAHLEGLVRRDELTGLLNRRGMDERLREVEAAGAAMRPCCVVMIDLDHFKRVNDELGHAEGDAVLQRFAAIASQALRAGDVLARWGGEEFVLLLPQTPPAQALHVVERLRVDLAEQAMGPATGRRHVTLSAGVTQWVLGEAAESVLDRADQLAYQAKLAGRNRCISDLAPPGEGP